MTFDWSKYIAVAETLKQHDTPEANRSGISRAYYAAFGKSKILCVNCSIVKHQEILDNSSRIHQFIIEKLVLSEHDELQEIGARLKTLRSRRNDADYNASCTESGKLSLLNSTISLSKEVLNFIRDYTP